MMEHQSQSPGQFPRHMTTTPPPREPALATKQTADSILPRRLFENEIDRRRQMLEPQRESIGLSLRLPTNTPRTPPPREPPSGPKRTADGILPQRFLKRPNPEPQSPTSRSSHPQKPTPVPNSDTTKNPTIRYNPKWVRPEGRSYGGPSSQKGKSDWVKGSEADVVPLPGPSSSSKQ